MGMGASGNTAISGSGGGGVNLDTARFASGIEGIQRLCKALLSSKFVENAMEAWGGGSIFPRVGGGDLEETCVAGGCEGFWASGGVRGREYRW